MLHLKSLSRMKVACTMTKRVTNQIVDHYLKNGVFPFDTMRELIQMTVTSTYPNREYSDLECNIWSMIRDELRKNNIEFKDR